MSDITSWKSDQSSRHDSKTKRSRSRLGSSSAAWKISCTRRKRSLSIATVFTSFRDGALQPSARKRPIQLHGSRRNAQLLRGFFHSKPHKKAQPHDVGHAAVVLLQLVERITDGEDVVAGGVEGHIVIVDVETNQSTTVAYSFPAARSFDQNAPHRFRRRTVEMSIAVPGCAAAALQAQKRLVHELGGLQGVAFSFGKQTAMRQ